MARKRIIAGNWKMHSTISQSLDYIQTFSSFDVSDKVYLAVPYTAIHPAANACKDTNIVIGAQNMHPELKGAFTGEISIGMLKEAGAQFVLIGHSERRHVFKEDDSFINKKLLRAAEENFLSFFCIGETEQQRENNQTKEVLKNQLTLGLANISSKQMNNIIVAYEPVWAIGTGKTATPEMAQEAHSYIRACLAELYDDTIAQQLSILYGGSVKPDNIAELISQKDIDGALVGGASLKPDSFSQLVKNSG
jgi:triosephosphate isomerase